MQETMRVLRSLQELDGDLYRVKDELRRLPQEMQRRRERIDRDKERVAEMDHNAHELRTRVKEIEDMTTQARQRQRKLEGEAAKTADQALIVAFQHEMKSIKRDISEAEEEGLTLIEEETAIMEERNALQEQIDEAELEFAQYSGNVEQEIDAAQKRQHELDEERRKRLASKLAPEVVSTYEKLLDFREGQAMAELDGRVCQGCYVSVPHNIYVKLARAQELVKCPSCNRILYLPD